MKLIATEKEINALIDNRLLSPAPNEHFILSIRDSKGVLKKEISVTTEKTKDVEQPLTLFGESDGVQNISKWINE